jgi:beta-lactamase class A
MNSAAKRRSFLLALLPFVMMGSARADEMQRATAQLQKLESQYGVRLGVFAIETSNGAEMGYRQNERFPFCSTFKAILAGAILARSQNVPGLLERRIRYDKSKLKPHSPITEKHLADGMTVAQLCAAAIQYSDNAAANQLLRILGGPPALTAFVRSIGDSRFRLDRWETALNSALPGDPRDTSTPAAMGASLLELLRGKTLTPTHRDQLLGWMLGNTTGDKRIKAGLPAGWKVGDKTGTGDYGTANDIAVLWSKKHKPVIVAIYTTRAQKDAAPNNEVIVAATRVIMDWVRAN